MIREHPLIVSVFIGAVDNNSWDAYMRYCGCMYSS